jgi:hypothetical protein
MFSMMIFQRAAVASFLVLSNVVGVTKAWAPGRHFTKIIASQGATVQQQRYNYNNNKYLFATQLHSTVATTSSVTTEVVGTEGTESFRLAFKDGSSAISPWHNIPWKNDDGTYNMVCSWFVVLLRNVSLACHIDRQKFGRLNVFCSDILRYTDVFKFVNYYSGR